MTSSAYQVIHTGNKGKVLHAGGVFVVEWDKPVDGAAPRMFVGATTSKKTASLRDRAERWAMELADRGPD